MKPRMRLILVAALVLVAFVVVPAGPIGTASAVWCGPDEEHCCGEPITVPVTKKQIPNPMQC